jgi:pilus assembly protein CpaC
MHRMKRIRCRVLAGLATLAGMVCATAQAQPPAPSNAPPLVDAKYDKTTGAVIVPLGGAAKLDPGKNKLLTELVIRGDEDVVTARPDGTSKFAVLIGRRPGVTKIRMTFEDKTALDFEILVQPDYELLRSVIKRAAPTASVEVLPGVGNVIILTGYVTRPEDRDLVVQIASSALGGATQNVLSNIQIGGAQHVQIDVMVAQVDRTELRERGTSFGVGGTTIGFSSIVGGLATSNVSNNLLVAGAAAAGPITVGANANLVAGIVPAQFIGALRALKTEGLAKFLAEPKVVAQTGRPTLLRAGGQQAILGPAAGINGPGVILEQVGTQLEVLPIVFGNGRIYLEVNPQFRSVNAGRGVTTAFGFTPGFNESSIRSSVTMESGQTFAIGGLIEHSVQGSVEKVPYLGDLPLLGAAFSSVRQEERETELLILVTPRLVDALDCNQLPKRLPGRESRSPDDYELFLESLIEAPRGQRRPWTGWRYNAAYKSDPTVGTYPGTGTVSSPTAAPAMGTWNPVPVAPIPAPANVMPIGSTQPAEFPVLPATVPVESNNPSQP